MNRTTKCLYRDRWLYLMMVPGLLFFIIFRYAPMYGVIIAFQDFRIRAGIFGSEWVGLMHFEAFFTSPHFSRVMSNTIILSFYHMLFGFPIPILFALLLNELRHNGFKRFVQTVTYLPHFISWVVIGNLALIMLAPHTGLISQMLNTVTGRNLNLLMNPNYFRGVLVATDIWRSMGWSAIIYLAAIAGVDPALYEAADIDGAGRGQKMFHITFPAIRNVIVIMLLLRVAFILDAGFEQILIMSNPLVNDVTEIIDTYVFRVGLLRAEHSYGTAVNLFKSVVGLTLVLIVNRISKRWEAGI